MLIIVIIDQMLLLGKPRNKKTVKKALNHLEMDYAHWQIDHKMSFVCIPLCTVA